jgi:diguanylate cyclase (GGDEF)-like protein
VAGLQSGDRPSQVGDERIEGQQGNRGAGRGGTLERDHTLADRDHTLADADQRASDSDQSAADDDQAASDRDLAGGGDLAEHELTRALRERSAEQRHENAHARVEAANARDAVARARDLAAAARDAAAALRDRELAERDAAATDARRVAAADAGLPAGQHRRRAATRRLAAAESRARAAADREQAARDREQAARDRLQAQMDREALLEQLAIAETDALTGTRTRAAGLPDFDREIDRARRLDGVLAVAYVDVVGLKAVNDAHGHSAGDALLRRAVQMIRSHLRSYDLIVRLGGDEFLCAMSGATIEDARQRFDGIQAALAAEPEPAELNVGFAALSPEDGAADLIERADPKLPSSRPRNP